MECVGERHADREEGREREKEGQRERVTTHTTQHNKQNNIKSDGAWQTHLAASVSTEGLLSRSVLLKKVITDINYDDIWREFCGGTVGVSLSKIYLCLTDRPLLLARPARPARDIFSFFLFFF